MWTGVEHDSYFENLSQLVNVSWQNVPADFGHKFSRPGARDFCPDVSIVDLRPASIDNPLTAQHVTMQ